MSCEDSELDAVLKKVDELFEQKLKLLEDQFFFSKKKDDAKKTALEIKKKYNQASICISHLYAQIRDAMDDTF